MNLKSKWTLLMTICPSCIFMSIRLTVNFLNFRITGPIPTNIGKKQRWKSELNLAKMKGYTLFRVKIRFFLFCLLFQKQPSTQNNLTKKAVNCNDDRVWFGSQCRVECLCVCVCVCCVCFEYVCVCEWGGGYLWDPNAMEF